MIKKIPDPIRNHLLKYAAALIVFGGVGIIIGIACSDRVIILLTILILVAGFARLNSLLCLARKGDYEEVSGTVLSDIPMHRKHKLVMKTLKGEEKSFILSGRPNFSTGSECTIYISLEDREVSSMDLPQFLTPPRTILGISLECKQR